ncbi:ATG C-terminal domain-containing protein [Phlyctema vagabunda]|uniref:Autophagy-related protein 2 n=1 Tax=Phlyctema vagabunda TaxID=108571 RepID=A0ABR4PHI8_9HELO
MASYFHSYFQASSMPKRLLQYALSRLEILDTSALGLDNLDIAWGKNSEFVFKDVGLKLRKLENLLQLPPSFKFSKARVLLLRITIPVDIYSSPILVEVEGVECQLCIQDKSTGHNRKRKQSRPYPRSSSIDSKAQDNEDRTSAAEVDGSEPVIPTAADLAQSFLQTEPKEEKAQLEAAILSRTQDLDSSTESSEDSDDLPLGTGTPLSLPAFMTNFLQGIVDRLQVRIRGINLSLEVEVPNEGAESTLAHSTDPVTVQLRIDTVDIEGVTHELSDFATDVLRPVRKEGKRLICLNKIRGALVTEANLFSSLARSSAVSSPSIAHSDLFESREVSSTYSSARESGLYSAERTRSPEQALLASSRRLSSPTDHNGRNSGILGVSKIASDSGRFDDACEDDENSDTSDGEPPADLLLSHMRDSVFESSAYLDQIYESQHIEDPAESLEGSRSSLSHSKPAKDSNAKQSSAEPQRSLPSPPATYGRDSSPAARNSNERRIDPKVSSTALPSRTRTRFSDHRVSQSQPLLSATLNKPHNEESPEFSKPDDMSDKGQESEDEDNISSPVGEEDLAQSQIFSHEEAESMYLSAISYGSNSPTRVPGGWADSNHDNQQKNSEPEDISDQLDNLEHALSNASVHESSELDPAISETPKRVATPEPNSYTKSPTISTSQNPSNFSEPSATSSEDYSRMTKQIFNLDQVAIYVPGTNTPTEDLVASNLAYGDLDESMSFTTTLDGSTAPNIPGAFSVPRTPRHPKPSKAVTSEGVSVTDQKDGSDDSTEVHFGKLSTQFDVSVGRLFWRIYCRLQEALKTEHTTAAPSQDDSGPSKKLKLGADSISFFFLEKLQGTMGPLNTVFREPWAEPPETDVLLRTSLAGLDINTSISPSSTEVEVALKRFAFGYARENIISFDAGLQMRSSVRDLSGDIDLTVKYHKMGDKTRCEIKTLPVHVSIDLQKLDETFSWFGGLSSVLNMGSSIASTSTVTVSPIRSKPRGVHFQSASKPSERSLDAKLKVDARIGGFVLDLLGKECSIGVDTSSIKTISRDALIGVSIAKIRMSGPHLRGSTSEPAISAEISSTRIEFQPTPKESDLSHLLSLITPSKAKYDQDDDILFDTLLRQRKQGSVLRVKVEKFETRIGRLDELNYLPELGEELARLSTVAKYLPDDDRPGLLSLVSVGSFSTNVDMGGSIGVIQFAANETEVAQVTLPALIALSVNSVSVHRNGSEELVGAATDIELREPRARSPAIMARMIGDEMEPVIKIKLWNLKVEYRVPTLMAILGLRETASPQELSASLTASVATLTGVDKTLAQQMESSPESPGSPSKSMTVDVVMRDCVAGLNPLGISSKVLLVLSESHIVGVLPKNQNVNINAEIGKASLLIIDNVANIASTPTPGRSRRVSFDGGNSQVIDLCNSGFVSIGYISSAKAIVQVNGTEGDQSIEVELRDDLFVLESCADSTQTLITALNGLTPPTPPSKETKYRTTVIPVQDLLASLSGDAFGTAEGDYNFDDDFGLASSESGSSREDLGDLDFDSNYIHDEKDDDYKAAISESRYGEESSDSLNVTSRDTHDGVLLESFAEPQDQAEDSEPLDFQEDHFGTGSVLEGTAHKWNSAKNTYDRSNLTKVGKSPLKVCVRDVHVIWNLFDGYDWQHTRDTITKAVADVESKANERRGNNRLMSGDNDMSDDETVIGDFLFNSIYIGVPPNRDATELAANINQELNDDYTETESVTATNYSSSTARQEGLSRVKPKRLRLQRSKHHKITFELKGVCVDLVAFPPGSGETQSSIDVRVRDFDIFDHIPTSSWRKFATYMHDAGERETGASQIHIQLLNVKPLAELAASEIVLKATVLPLRLHVDQDALDFITRFFEFKDEDSAASAEKGDAPFLQRVEVNAVPLKLDFKPKRVDYAGLRSGHTTEFMNFVGLDEANMTLNHTIIYGINGFDKLSKCLNDIWMPDIKRNQLPGILTGVAPVRSIANVGGGLQQLVFVPLHEYKKDGRIVRSIAKGATAFAKTTGTELVKLGAKVAIGMQTALQGAEGMLGQPGESSSIGVESDEEDRNQISLYANQPVGVFQGLRGGYTGLQRDLLVARDAIIAVPGEVMEEGTAAGVLRAVRKHAPTVILRPAIGVAKAGGQILMGATNSMDPNNLKKAKDKYKSY